LARPFVEVLMNIAVSGLRKPTLGVEGQPDFRPLARALRAVTDFPANEIIFREGDPPRYMYVVLKGRIEVSAKRKVIETIGEGEALGILSLLDGNPRTIAARAIEPCDLALPDVKKFRFMIEETPNFVWFVLTEQASRLRATNALL
jgi:CRP/FNR family transcriptional regulator, cyclic AMP receptor protein